AGAGLGYPIAAAMADLWGIRAAFGVGTAVCAATLVLALVALPPNPDTDSARVDWWGTALLAGGTTAILLALAQVSSAPAGPVLGLAALGVLAVVGWVWWSRRVPHPLVDIDLARHPVPLLS